MKLVKAFYGIKGNLKKNQRKILSPAERAKVKREMSAVMDLAGLWEDKDTSFFDKR